MTSDNAKTYSEWLLESLDTRQASPKLGEFAKDAGYRVIDDAMREIAGKEPSARDREIQLRHETGRSAEQETGIEKNIHYLTANGFGLLAFDKDIEGFFRVLYDHASAFLPAGKERPLLYMWLEFWPEQKELLARACAFLIGVEHSDLFDAKWRLKFSVQYLEQCLRHNEILTGENPDYARMKQVFCENL